MKNKFTAFFFLLGLVALILFQRELVMPLVKKVVNSDLFMVDTNDKGSDESVSNIHTQLAFSNCNNYIKQELDNDYTVLFAEKPINAWAIGNYQYVINAEVEITGANTGSKIKRYVCRISYTEGSDESGLMNPDNWSVYGLSGIDEI